MAVCGLALDGSPLMDRFVPHDDASSWQAVLPFFFSRQHVCVRSCVHGQECSDAAIHEASAKRLAWTSP